MCAKSNLSCFEKGQSQRGVTIQYASNSLLDMYRVAEKECFGLFCSVSVCNILGTTIPYQECLGRGVGVRGVWGEG